MVFAPADLAVTLASALGSAGIAVDAERTGRFAAALRLVPPISRAALYWCARTTLVGEQASVPAFDLVFSAVFDGVLDPADQRGDTTAPRVPAPARPGQEQRPGAPHASRTSPMGGGDPAPALPGAGEDDRPVGEREAVLAAASTAERLHTTSFAELDAEDIEAARALVRQLTLTAPPRRTRRTRPSRRRGDAVDLRATARAARGTGGEPVVLVRRRRRQRPRRLVLLCDVSASMEPYTRVFLTLAQSAVTAAHAEAFVFSTRLTRLTTALAVRDPDAALARSAKVAPDWAGGTRLAEGLQRFLDGYGRRGMARGAVVVVLSDGWSHEDPALVGAQMARLRRVASRIVWVNPRKAAPGFAPLVGGMAAALPHCDAFVSGHSLAALEEAVAAIRAPRSTPTRRAHP